MMLSKVNIFELKNLANLVMKLLFPGMTPVSIK